ncbi:MAG: excinuclease ABC subunit C [Deltaproteobacteria bacterium HGW-Deltaproteobacteria-13]|jgi:excinuclease ABC subunit C|nr:MAG: excinuclease ABC subunit C [Deltaproteobacteria bacterium HGW-Deltaproteobacteria-13]
MEENNALKDKIGSFPRSPGVYLMKDSARKIIYVGKANDLKSRVASYFTGKDTRPMAPFLMARVHDIEFINTVTEKEALILENNLIKRHRPRYNVTLRDDKTYYHLSLDPTEKFPRLQLVRKRFNDAALYFGPYPSGLAAKETLRFVLQVFPLRSCRNRDFKLRPRPCLEYQIGRCLAPCKGLIDEEAYKKLTQSAVSFLQGRRRELISELKKQMDEASGELNYEEAARLRDRIGALEHALEKQHVDWGGTKDQDVIGLYAQDDHYQLCILFVRGGKLLGSKSFAPVKIKMDMAEIVSSCLTQFYDDKAIVPDEIIIPCHLPDEEVIIEWLAEKKNKKVALTVPSIGTKNALLDMANDNARNLWEAAHKKEEQKSAALLILYEKLSLSRLPRRMECYDISNISGKHAVGSMVVFQDGEPDKNSYRRYRIKALSEPDDYAMMYEVLSRRFARGESLPDLVVVDGGKGQLGVALLVLKDLKIKVDVIGLAKEERAMISGKGIIKKKVAKSEDRVYLPGRKDAVYLSAWPHALRILQQVRDEAHRFALSYHHQLKQKDDMGSILDDIADVGQERRKILLKHFGSSKRVREASLDDLQKVPGIGKSLAEKIYNHLKSEK